LQKFEKADLFREYRPPISGAPLSLRAFAFAFDLSVLHGTAKFASEWISLCLLRLLLKGKASGGSAAFKMVAAEIFQQAFSYANYYTYLPTLVFFGFLYFTIFIYFWSSTLGQGLAGIVVVDRRGNTPSLDQIVRRYWAMLFSCLTAGFFFLAAMVSKNKTCFQDDASATFTIRRPRDFFGGRFENKEKILNAIPEVIYLPPPVNSHRKLSGDESKVA
jgi:uncharacterized RDD family membrane protein YckC